MNPKKKVASRQEVVLKYESTRIPWKFTEGSRPPENNEELAEYIRCASSPAHFLNNYCFIQDPVKGRIPFLLFPFQKTTLKHFLLSVFNIVLKPRQMGLSWLTALFALWFAMFRPDQTVEIISIKEKTAQRFMDKIKYTYKHLPPWLKGEIEHENTLELIFKNNSRIMSVPTSEDAGRSEGLSLLIVDEAAFVRWIEKIWSAAFPTLSTGGMAILISTANGLGNFFANKWKDACSGESDFNPVKLHWKMHPNRDEQWYRIQRRELGPALCAQEVDCDFLNSGRPVFDSAIIMEWADILRHKKPIKVLYANDQYDDIEGLYGKRAEGLYIFKEPQVGHSYLIGADVATGDGNDYHGAQVVDWQSGEQVAELRLMCKPDVYVNYLVGLGKKYNWAQIVPERNGVGLVVVQKLIDKNYPNIYAYMKEDATIDPEVSTKQLVSENTLMLGFTTTKANRPVLISTLEEMVREHDRLRNEGVCPKSYFLVNGMRTLNEMIVFNWQETGMPNPRANEGYNDDLVIALMLAQLARMRYRPQREMPVLFS